MTHATEAGAPTAPATGPTTSHPPHHQGRPVNANALTRLREPFAKSEIRYLPRVWCKACRDSRAGCNKHTLKQCGKCGNRLSTAHIDLAYVGHAEATNRLLNVDPAWSWEPLAVDEKGLPQYDANGGLWIRLTVCGVTRLGYGHAEGKRGGDAVKEIIGDAIRNAGMRFGMALDLWTSSDLEIADNGSEGEPSKHLQSVRQAPAEPDAQSTQARDYLAEARAAGTAEDAVRIYREAEAADAAPDCLAKLREIGRAKRAAAVPTPPEDPPVQPEPTPAPREEHTTPAETEPAPEPPGPQPDERQEALAAMWKAAKAANFLDGLPDQFAQSFGHPIEQGTTDEFRHARELMLGTTAA